MKPTKNLLLSLILAAPIAAFAQSSSAPKLTVRECVELYGALTTLDKGGSKVVDGKEAHVPFIFASTVRWTLSCDESAVKVIAEDFNANKARIVGEVASRQTKDDPSASAKFDAGVDKELEPILKGAAPDPQPVLKKVSLADLALDTNNVDIATLSGLRPIISDQ